MPVIGHAANNGHLSFIYKLGQNDFLRAVSDTVHAAHPFHLVGGFQGFGYALLLRHSEDDSFHTLIAGLVDLGKVPMQRSACEQVCVENGAMFFQIAAAHTPVFAYLLFAVIRQSNVGNEIIAHLTVCTAHFFKDGFHKIQLLLC